MYEAEFTTEAATRPICQRCKVSFPPGTKLYHMHSRNPLEPGRDLCEECHAYYLQKGTTRRRDAPAPAMPSNASTQTPAVESHSDVRHNIAAAQRGERTHPVVAIGNLNIRSRAWVQDSAAPASVFAMPPPQIIPGSQYNSLPFPSVLGAPLVNPGYQEAHEVYKRMRTYFQNQAYSNVANSELITAQFWMSVHLPNKKKPTPLPNVFEAISDIPVHIGHHQLKFVAFHALLPHFVKWSEQFPLHIDACTLRNNNWVELMPRHPDVDIIADKFFESRGKKRSHELYESIQDHIEAKEAKRLGLHIEESSKHHASFVRVKSKKTGRKRKAYELGEVRPSARSPSPDPSQVRRALASQVPPRRQNMKLLFDTITIALQFFRLPKVSFNHLVNNRDLFLNPQGFESLSISLNYNPTAKQISGGFKLASFGYTSFPLFRGGCNKVCFKQCYNTKPGTRVRQIYKGVRQAEDLTMELNCIGWASTLMDLVYDFMEAQQATRGQPSFEVPQMRFVQAGIAISNTADKTAYLVEEFIDSDPSNGGWFTKYLNNRSAVPRKFSNQDQAIRAEFLSFCQHFQYWKTDGMVFVSDLQGGRDLLTDPQIITAP
ncbi:hypothetical protein BJ912DRAFT_1019943 [Pholiota molesta]|nr:hypothetical protein BJ912DRAFT_1019943 [Pholiota molesta]